MPFGIIDRRNHKYYTHMSYVFQAINNAQTEYNWLITDCECYPTNKKIESLLNQKYCWLSGDELSTMIKQEDFQWIWGCLCGFTKDIPLEKVLSHPLPSAQDYNGYYQNPLSLQHPLSSIEIIPCDSSWILVVSENKNLIDNYLPLFFGRKMGAFIFCIAACKASEAAKVAPAAARRRQA